MTNDQKLQEFKPDQQIEVKDQMVEAGVERLNDLLSAGVGSAYVVSEVFQAMILGARFQADRQANGSKADRPA